MICVCSRCLFCLSPSPIKYFVVLGISLVDETPVNISEDSQRKPAGLAEGVDVAYDLPAPDEASTGPTVQDTDISLEQLMAQMKKI